MRIIDAGYNIEDEINGESILKRIEKAGRTCYKSEDKITGQSAKDFVTMIMKRGHDSVLEHEKLTVRFICDRGVTHEIVRHRIGSYSQESTRYCNYSKEKFGQHLTFIRPCFFTEESNGFVDWQEAMKVSEHYYLRMIGEGASPQEARSVLPNSLKTEIVCTYNLREWRHFLKLRTSSAAHPQMRELTIPLLKELQARIPIIFDDIFIGKGQL